MVWASGPLVVAGSLLLRLMAALVPVALDAKAEHEMFQRFTDLTDGKLALFISHRFSTVRMADRIVVLADGRIAQEGSHMRLMQMKRRYFGMFELQAANYR
jgi:ATP-binding cassette subfamily B protein